MSEDEEQAIMLDGTQTKPNKRLILAGVFFLCVIFLALTALLLVARLWISDDSSTSSGHFEVVCLGPNGGLVEGTVSSYLLRLPGGAQHIALDGGTMLPGIAAANSVGAFDHLHLAPEVVGNLTVEGYVFKNLIVSYLLSHAHLDHSIGLIMASPEDAPSKAIVVTNVTYQFLSASVFNNEAWANFWTGGTPPVSAKYQLLQVDPSNSTAMTPIPGSPFAVRTFYLSHGIGPYGEEYLSTAFLISNLNGSFILYFGDTGPDSVEGYGRLRVVWEAVAPLWANGSLHGILLECSYDNSRPDNLLFGHLTPAHLLTELSVLSAAANRTLEGLKLVVTHIKPEGAIYSTQASIAQVILAELQANNTLGVQFILPQQGHVISF